MKIKRKLNKKGKLIILIVAVLIFSIPFVFTFSRYVINTLSEHYYTSRHFFFSSSMLDGRTHNLYNYDGIGTYTFKVDLTNGKDSLNYTTYDINYTVELSCKIGSTIIPCAYTDSGIGTLTGNGSLNTNYLLISVNSGEISLSDGDEVEINISVSSTGTYRKTLSSKFILVVNEKGVAYSITDSSNSLYLDLIITNNKENKNIVVNFDENLLQVDMSSFLVRSADRSAAENGKTNAITFFMPKGQTYSIRFYKVDPTQSYSLNSNVITVS